MASGKHVRIKDIADHLGISLMSVSVALRGMPGVSEKTRKAVKECAEKLGYRPDPAMSALADYRRRVRPTAAFAQLAFVTDFPVKNDPFWSYTNEFLYGAQQRGLEYGYDVVPFWLREGGMTRKQASSVLFNRGIKGLLIAPLPVEDGHLDDLTWKYFSAVAVGPSLASPLLDQALFDHHYSTRMVLDELRLRGYQRVGFVSLKRRSTRVHHIQMDAYLGDGYRDSAGGEVRIPPLIPDAITSADFGRWLNAYKPDAILTDTPQVVFSFMDDHGLRAPQDLGVVCFASQPGEFPEVASVIQDFRSMGAVAVDRLHTNLLRNIYGIPEHAHGLNVRGYWQEGTTLRKRKDA